ncbi:MAG: cob(I)yrinic acid a,c-diamide adenosyltransferase [Planctomycetota bacterium]
MSRIIVHTGEGRGKTTAAVGTALRMLGHGGRVSLIHFIKGRESGEAAALRRLGATVHVCGLGFTRSNDNDADRSHAEAAAAGMQLARAALAAGVDLLVLDEICGAMQAGLVAEQDLQALLAAAEDGQTVICTGRYASEALMARADTVSEIHNHKHALAAGIPAQAGVEL